MLPTLETARLILRPYSLADVTPFYEMNKEWEVVKYTGNAPMTSLAQAKEVLTQVVFPQYLNGIGRMAVLLKSNLLHIGFCGIKYEEEVQAFDLGYRFIVSAWGQGYATESAQAVLQHFMQDSSSLTPLIARAMKENTASLKVIEKLGFTFISEKQTEDGIECLYRWEK